MRHLCILMAFTLTLGLLTVFLPTQASAHCQIPCGIYDDPARIATMREDAATIRKATAAIAELASAGTAESMNQSTRWVVEKDRSAANIQEITASYFLAQRVKAAPEDSPQHGVYLDQLEGFHAVLVAAMKCKQNVDSSHVDALDSAIETVAMWYD